MHFLKEGSGEKGLGGANGLALKLPFVRIVVSDGAPAAMFIWKGVRSMDSILYADLFSSF